MDRFYDQGAPMPEIEAPQPIPEFILSFFSAHSGIDLLM